ncbi:MAG: hypothetical protein AB8B82_14505 [Roseovarius sp.]
MKQVIILVLITALTGCGGVHKARKDTKRQPVATPVASTPSTPITSGVSNVPAAPVRMPFANGPLNKACMASDRKARSRALCGCIQSVADNTLSGSQQRMAVSFYNDPHKAQVIRQSDNTAHEAFWKDYRNYGDTAERVCR